MHSGWAKLAVVLASAVGLAGGAPPHARSAQLQFTISFPASVHAQPITGRVFLVVTRDSAAEPRLTAGSFTTSVPLFGADVSELRPGQAAVITDTTPGYPTRTLRDIPAGDNYIPAGLNHCTPFHPTDGEVGC